MSNDTTRRITAKMVLDSTSYNSSLKGLNAEMKKHQAELKLASQGIKSFGKDSERLKSVQESLSKQVELHSKKVDLYRKSIEKAKSKMEENIKERDKLKNSLDQANKKYNEAVKIYGKESVEAKKAKEEVDRLSKEHEKSSKAVETNAKQVQGYETNLAKAETQMIKTEAELQKVNNELDKSNNKWLNASEKLKKSSEKLKNVGGKIEDVGSKLTTHVTAPLAAVGIASVKVGMDFESEMSKVQAISGATGEDFKKLKEKAEEMGSKTKFSATESAEGLEYMAMAGWKTQDMLDGLPPILNLAIASGEQLGTTSDIVTDALTAFGLKAKDAGMFSDVLAAASSNANTNVGMMGATFQYAAPVAGALRYSVQDTAIAIGLMANAGIKADKAGTAIRTGLTNLVKPTDTMADAMHKYGISVKDTNGKMKPFRQLIGELRGKLGKLDKATQANVVSTIFGKEAMSGWLSIINASPQDVDKLTKAIDNSKGATDKMSKTMSNNAKGSITEMKSALEGAGIKIFEVVAPSVTKLAKQVSVMADKFSKLNPKTQETIVKMAALGIATGPIVGGIGKTIKGVGSLIGGLSKLTGFLGKIKTATTAVSGATTIATKGISAMGLVTKASALLLNPWTIGIAAAGVGAYALHKHLSKEATPSIDLFNNKLQTTQTVVDRYGNKMQVATTKNINFAKSTKKAVGGFISLNDEAKKQLTNLYVNSTKITSKLAKELTSKYKKMGEQIKAGEDKKYKERLENFKKFLDKNKKMSAKDKKQALESMKKAHLNQQKQTDKYTKQIQDILNKASKEKRALTLNEQQSINKIQEKMKSEGIKKLSKTEEESKAILSRIKSYGSRITAEQASSIIKNAEKQRKDSVKNAEQQYKETVAQIKKMRDEDKTITKDQADKLIKEAERQKKDTIKKAEEQKQSVVKKMKEQNKDLENSVNMSNGKIKSNWDQLKTWFSNNPIVRWIKSKVEQPATQRNVGHNWTGTNYWEGGLTYLHDAPGKNNNYELYDLPKGTRIYNHDASEDLIVKTAQNVAQKIADNALKNINNNNSSTLNIKIEKAYMNSKEDIKHLAEELEFYRKQNKLALGGV